MTEFQKMISGELYNSLDSVLVTMRKKARLLFEKYNKSSIANPGKRYTILKKLFGTSGKNIYVEPPFYCDYGSNIHIGNNFYANFNCVILDVAEVIIGDNCFIAPQVGIYTATHPVDPVTRCSGAEYGKKIIIGNNCWIGGHATINPGVVLGNNVVVASGSEVTKSFPDNVVIAGVPAKIIRYIK
ncbi:MAG: maltose O-acetyltransferase [Spirochaetes bacterium RIFOXYB1_FULL_32_8]|nr:MAG: maltose O-acetyltransferase [Spirochaetes bacterium RIFOXYB1_FULL_32_8]